MKVFNKGELYAIYVALRLIIKKFDFRNITVYTDSEYSINSLTKWVFNWASNNWIGSNKKPIKNQDIIKALYKIVNKYKARIKFVHVRSHTKKTDFNSISNDMADKLAVRGAKMSIENNNK